MTSLHIEPLSAVEPEEGLSAAGSTLDHIRSLYRGAEREHHLDLPLPRNPVMGVRYRVIDPDEITTDTTRSNRDMNLDFVIAACQAILIREGDEWEPLTHQGEPVGFDETLAEIIGVPSLEQGGTARQVVIKAFSTAPSPHLAVANHVLAITDWMAGAGPVDEEFLLGKS
jgi:hypothetical protein